MPASDLGFYLLIAILAMSICMAIIPLMIRIAPVIGMVDQPDERKVHASTIPRSGGIGIIVGLLVPLLVFLDFDRHIVALLVSITVLLLFGAWDDTCNIRPGYKFLGQILAAGIFVYAGDTYVYHFPFMGFDPIPAWIGMPFTVVAIVGMINALNLSDGLDGLAGGEALISLIAIAYMSYQFGGDTAMAISAATIGGIFGFLRFNSHPARIFMGDAGSQTLGFILGVMVVMLTQRVNPVMSPVAALLLLGLPVLDSLAVFYMRARRGDSLVVAAKDHLHHRLLELGYRHYESVMIIYSVQAVFVITAILIPYEHDFLIMGLYLTVFALVFGPITLAERTGFRIHAADAGGILAKQPSLPSWLSRFSNFPATALETGVSLLFVGATLMAGEVSEDFGIASVLLLLVLGGLLLGRRKSLLLPYRLVTFVTAGFAVYLLSSYPPGWLFEQQAIVYMFYGLLTLATFLTARMLSAGVFQVTPLDYLVIIIALAIALIPESTLEIDSIMMMAIQMIILFYACEMVIQSIGSVYNRFTGSLAVSLVIISLRAFL